MRKRDALIVTTVAGLAFLAVAGGVALWLVVRASSVPAPLADPPADPALPLDSPPGWAEIAVSERGTPAFEQLDRAIGFSGSQWSVRATDGRVTVVPEERFAGPRPPFQINLPDNPLWGHSPVAAAEVPGGWLAGYDHGEWGGAVWWFSPDGRKRAEVSGHQVHQCARTPAGLFAVAGLAHLGTNEGQVLRLTERDGRWQAEVVADLPAAGRGGRAQPPPQPGHPPPHRRHRPRGRAQHRRQPAGAGRTRPTNSPPSAGSRTAVRASGFADSHETVHTQPAHSLVNSGSPT